MRDIGANSLSERLVDARQLCLKRVYLLPGLILRRAVGVVVLEVRVSRTGHAGALIRLREVRRHVQVVQDLVPHLLGDDGGLLPQLPVEDMSIVLYRFPIGKGLD